MRFKTAALLAAAVFFVFTGQSFAADGLYSQFSRKGTVKVFVQDPSDVSAVKKVDLPALKKLIEEALVARKSIQFEVVPAREAAEVAVETEIAEYFWTDHDPVDMIMGAGGAAYDAVTVEHYARIQANMTVKDAKTGRALWKDKVMATVTDAKMPEAEGPKLAGQKLAQDFVADAFGKKKGRR